MPRPVVFQETVPDRMATDPLRNDTATADALLWQTSYRLILAMLAGSITVGSRIVGAIRLSPVADAMLGRDLADWMLAITAAIYTVLVIGMRSHLRTTKRAGSGLATLMVAADLFMVFWLLFLLAAPTEYHLGLFVALFSLQLTQIYFGRSPAILTLSVTALAYVVLNELVDRSIGQIHWPEVFRTLVVFGLGGLAVTMVQGNLHERLGKLVGLFERAEDGDFAGTYDVAADPRPDAVTAVGRSYNRFRTQLMHIVHTDPLTGCFNRNGFDQQLRRELARAVRNRTEVTVLAIDLDQFQRVNEQHGHLVGDEVIAEVGALLRGLARADDVVGRTAGEEFMLLAPSTTSDGAQFLSKRVVDAFRAHTFGNPKISLALTVSIGVATVQVGDENMIEALRARADEALYASQRAGQNTVTVWRPGLERPMNGNDAAIA